MLAVVTPCHPQAWELHSHPRHMISSWVPMRWFFSLLSCWQPAAAALTFLRESITPACIKTITALQNCKTRFWQTVTVTRTLKYYNCSKTYIEGETWFWFFMLIWQILMADFAAVISHRVQKLCVWNFTYCENLELWIAVVEKLPWNFHPCFAAAVPLL